MYDHLYHLKYCDIDTHFLVDYALGSQQEFYDAWARTDFHFEYRMDYLDSLLYFTDALGQMSYVARNCYLT